MTLDITQTPDDTKVVNGNIPVFVGSGEGNKPSALPPPPPPPQQETPKPPENQSPSSTDGKPVPPTLQVDEYFEQKKLSTSGVFAIISLAVFLIVAFLLYFQSVALNSRIKTNQKKQDEIKAQLNAKDVVKIKDQTGEFALKEASLSTIQNNDILLEDVIKKVAQTVVKNGKINNLAIDQKGNVKIDLELKDVIDIRKQLLAFEENGSFKNVKMTSVVIASGDKAKNTMTVSASIVPSAFKAGAGNSNQKVEAATVNAFSEASTTTSALVTAAVTTAVKGGKNDKI